MTTDDIDAVIAGLTEAQRAIIRKAPIGSWWFAVTWEGWTWRTLLRRGLSYSREPGLQTLSPAGLALRARLQEQQP